MFSLIAIAQLTSEKVASVALLATILIVSLSKSLLRWRERQSFYEHLPGPPSKSQLGEYLETLSSDAVHF